MMCHMSGYVFRWGLDQVLDHMLIGTVMCLQVMCMGQVISQVMDHVMVGQVVKR